MCHISISRINIIKKLSFFLVYIILTAISIELLLRIFVPTPERILRVEKQAKPTTLDAITFNSQISLDEEVGWRNKPGTYLFKEVDYQITKTICEDFNRATDTSCGRANERPLDTSKSVILVGDSYTLGTGLSDHETLAWKLRNKIPSLSVQNWGVGGFGSCQVYRLIKDYAKNNSLKQTHIIYGFSDFHISRATAYPYADFDIARLSADKKSHYPVCFFNATKELISLPSRIYSFEIPLLSRSYLSNYLMDLYLLIWSRFFIPDERNFSKDFFPSLQNLIKSSGGDLTILMQDFSSESAADWYKALFINSKISFIDGSGYADMEYRLSDYHPNSKLNDIWLNLLEKEFTKPADGKSELLPQ